MPKDICTDVSEHLKEEIRKMLRMTRETRKGMSAELEDYKVKTYLTEPAKPSKGKAMIYTPGFPFLPTLIPDAKDVHDIVEKERPFVCRATRTPANVDVAACYTPGYFFKIYKRLREKNKESTKDFYDTLEKKYGTGIREPQTEAEESMADAIYANGMRLKHLAGDSAPAIIDTCRVGLGS